ncbi:MAG: hypothetical protein HY453_00655 [Parcubacteria group bacterium]|nr:hypothetical protein [Parcubacteria group bacterium]
MYISKVYFYLALVLGLLTVMSAVQTDYDRVVNNSNSIALVAAGFAVASMMPDKKK